MLSASGTEKKYLYEERGEKADTVRSTYPVRRREGNYAWRLSCSRLRSWLYFFLCLHISAPVLWMPVLFLLLFSNSSSFMLTIVLVLMTEGLCLEILENQNSVPA